MINMAVLLAAIGGDAKSRGRDELQLLSHAELSRVEGMHRQPSAARHQPLDVAVGRGQRSAAAVLDEQHRVRCRRRARGRPSEEAARRLLDEIRPQRERRPELHAVLRGDHRREAERRCARRWQLRGGPPPT